MGLLVLGQTARAIHNAGGFTNSGKFLEKQLDVSTTYPQLHVLESISATSMWSTEKLKRIRSAKGRRNKKLNLFQKAGMLNEKI